MGVDGICGAGKSTFARELCHVIRRMGRTAVLIDSDGFHYARDRRHRQGRKSTRGYYEDAYDFDSLASCVLMPLGPGGTGVFARRIHDLATDRTVVGERETAPRDAIVVFDATFIQRLDLRDLWDEIVFLHSDEAAATARGVRRDEAALGGADAARRAYENRYVAACRIYLHEERPRARASIVIDNTDVDAPTLERIG